MEGGIIQDIMSEEDLDVLILDFDTEGAEPEELIHVPIRAGADAVRIRQHVPSHPDGMQFVRGFYEYANAETLVEEEN